MGLGTAESAQRRGESCEATPLCGGQSRCLEAVSIFRRMRGGLAAMECCWFYDGVTPSQRRPLRKDRHSRPRGLPAPAVDDPERDGEPAHPLATSGGTRSLADNATLTHKTVAPLRARFRQRLSWRVREQYAGGFQIDRLEQLGDAQGEVSRLSC